MTTMTAILSDPQTGRLTEARIDRPEPGPHEVLVKVAAAGINPVDVKTRRGGGVFGFFDPAAPMILGWDIAGEVVDLGAGVTRFKRGDRVFGMPRFPQPASAYAEYVTAPSRQLAATPESLNDIEAAALPLAALTAWQAMEALTLSPGAKILIHAASGGVGHLAVQFAKASGAEVWGTASAVKHEPLKALGLDHPIDYRHTHFEDAAREMDAVLDLVGGQDYPTRSIQSLRRGGQLLVVPSPAELPDASLLESAGVSASWILVEPDYAALEKIASMVSSGDLKVHVGDTRPLASVGDLHELIESQPPMGKLVATVV